MKYLPLAMAADGFVRIEFFFECVFHHVAEIVRGKTGHEELLGSHDLVVNELVVVGIANATGKEFVAADKFVVEVVAVEVVVVEFVVVVVEVVPSRAQKIGRPRNRTCRHPDQIRLEKNQFGFWMQ